MNEFIRVAPSPIFLISYFNGAQVEVCTDEMEARGKRERAKLLYERGLYANNPDPTIFQLTQVS